LYKFFYNQIVSRLPDQLVEYFGGPFIGIIATFHFNKIISLPFTIANLKFENPVGMTSGWADSPKKINRIHKLGAGIVISKTITVDKRKGNPYPRIIRDKDILINSMGLPNNGVDWWENKLKANSNSHVRMHSIKGYTFEEWEILINKLEKFTEVFELNLSCPNIQEGIMDLKESMQLINDISSISTKPIWLKLSPEYPPKQNLELINKVRSNILGVTLINTIPVENNKLGNPMKIGGLSGRTIYPKLLQQLDTIRLSYFNHSELPIMATGGIVSNDRFWEILSKYKAIPIGLTGFLTQGPKYYYNVAKYIKNQMDYNEIDSVNSILE